MKRKTYSKSERWKSSHCLTVSSVECTGQSVFKMKHAKRTVLVPEDVLACFEQKQKLETSPVVANLMNTYESMQEILRPTDMTDDKKQKSYYTNLQRYLNLKQQKDSYVATVKIAFKNEKKDVAVELTEKVAALPDSLIVETVPKSMRGRAVPILNQLKSHPDIVTWDNTGQVRLDGVDIAGLNISDL